MCLVGGGGNASKPKVPPVAPPPSKAAVVTPTAPIPSEVTAIDTVRKALTKRQGIFGNIKTSPTGDATFGSSSMSGGYATFGGSKTS